MSADAFDNRYTIGIDPGTTTGFAVHDRMNGRLLTVTSMPLHEALFEVDRIHRERGRTGGIRLVRFEDARLRTWFGGADERAKRSGPGVREGVGSVKRDCAIWEEFLTARGIAFEAVKPTPGTTKWTAAYFERVSGWTGRTNEHARDAAILILGLKLR